MKQGVFASVLGVLGATIATLFGGWGASLTTLLIFMAIDFLSGLVVAGVFHKSNKSSGGNLDSRAGWKGLCRKGMTLLIVIVAHRIDLILFTTYVRDTVCIAFIVNEALSLLENAGLMGVPIPKPLANALNVLKDKSYEED